MKLSIMFKLGKEKIMKLIDIKEKLDKTGDYIRNDLTYAIESALSKGKGYNENGWKDWLFYYNCKNDNVYAFFRELSNEELMGFLVNGDVDNKFIGGPEIILNVLYYAGVLKIREVNDIYVCHDDKSNVIIQYFLRKHLLKTDCLYLKDLIHKLTKAEERGDFNNEKAVIMIPIIESFLN